MSPPESTPKAQFLAPLLTVAEVADRLRLGRSTIYRLVQDGDLAAVQIGRAVRFEAEAVDDFINSKRTSGLALEMVPKRAESGRQAALRETDRQRASHEGVLEGPGER